MIAGETLSRNALGSAIHGSMPMDCATELEELRQRIAELEFELEEAHEWENDVARFVVSLVDCIAVENRPRV
jgi:hypothetical protein